MFHVHSAGLTAFESRPITHLDVYNEKGAKLALFYWQPYFIQTIINQYTNLSLHEGGEVVKREYIHHCFESD